MDDKTTSALVACTLTPASQRSQIKRYNEEISPYILKRECLENGSLINFAVDAELKNKIQRIVELDKGCCAFLSHQVQSDDKNITWTITSEGAGIKLAQKYLIEQAPIEQLPSEKVSIGKNRLFGAGFKAAAILTACGFACASPLVLGAMGLSLAGIGLGAFGAKITTLGTVAIAAGAYWYYKKKKLHTAKGTKNENRCSC